MSLPEDWMLTYEERRVLPWDYHECEYAAARKAARKALEWTLTLPKYMDFIRRLDIETKLRELEEDDD